MANEIRYSYECYYFSTLCLYYYSLLHLDKCLDGLCALNVHLKHNTIEVILIKLRKYIGERRVLENSPK